MKFVYPEFLWAFGVLLIPVIIHLFNFRRYKTLYFSSLKFIQFVDQQTRSTKNLKHLLVLISRLLAFTFIVIAFAQPYIPTSGKSDKGGKPVLAIYIDNSFSMTLKGTEGELISEARELARKMIQKAPADTRFMLVTNNLSGVELRLTTKIDALERLDKIKESPLFRPLSMVIEKMKGSLKREKETNQKLGMEQFVLFSDFQKKSFDPEFFTEDTEVFYHPIKLVPQDASNLVVDSVWFTSPIHKIGTSNELNVRVSNKGKNDLTNVELHLVVGNIKRDVFIDLEANSYSTTVINYPEQALGIQKGVVSVNDKQFFQDDDYYFNYQVSSNSNVLIVNGENAVSNISLVYSLDNFYAVKEIQQNEFMLDALKEIDLGLQ